jgi:hypothetical protein
VSDEPPKAVDYLVPLFDKFGGLWFEHEIKSCAENLSGDELAALRDAYTAIGKNQQLQELTNWINQRGPKLEPPVPGAAVQDEARWINQMEATARERHLRRGAFVLLVVFEELGEKGISPFSDRTVRYIRKYPPRDWSRVPAEYQFLIPLAERYGIMLYEKGWDETLASVSPEIRSEMQRAGEELKITNRVYAVQDWMNAQPDLCIEVTALDGLLQLLDNFGMI